MLNLFLMPDLSIVFSKRLLLNMLFTGLLAAPVIGQTSIPLTDLSAFKNPGKSWRIAGDVNADLNKPNTLNISQGTGILVNLPVDKNGADLFTNAEYGDIDLELVYMIAKGSNSGVYLNGNYEVQLLDSWGVKSPTDGDNAAIYHRWDEARPEGRKGYEGYAPRQNASRAPGLWQYLRVSFQSPRFDANGKKVENAKILRLDLNGVTLHENVELLGVTRGAASNAETAKGPLRIQGDHGPIAIKDIKITTFDKPRPQLTNISYTVFKGRFDAKADLSKLPPEAQGTLGNLTAGNINNLPGEYFIRYSGTLKVAEPGQYSLNAFVPGGRGILQINKQPVAASGGRGGSLVTLPAGDLPFELLYTKTEEWTNRSLIMAVSGPGIREYYIGDPITSVATNQSADPILIDAPVNTIIRSFMDLPGGIRVVHAVSVGSAQQVHYTYDMDKGNIVQVWRGQFLDATPMWYGRGDGSSRPLGAGHRFGKPFFALAKLNSPQAPWIEDTTGSGYLPKGYALDANDLPTFRYNIYGATVQDAFRVMENGQGLTRELSIKNAPSDLYVRLASGSTIEMVNGLYVIDNKSFYLQLNAGDAKPIIRDVAGGKELIIPVKIN